MAKRTAIAKADRESGPGAELIALCQRITEHGKLTEEGIKDLIRWLRNNSAADLPAKDFLRETVVKIVGDRKITRDELREIWKAIESILPPESRRIVVQQRKMVEAERKQQNKEAKAAEKQREKENRARKLAASSVVMLTGKNGRQYQLDSLIGRVEYGEKTIEDLVELLGNDVAAVVEQHIKARERQYSGTFVNQTDAAWLIRLSHGGDHWLPKRSTRIVCSNPISGEVQIAIAPSLAAQIDSHTVPRNLLTFTTQQVAQRFNVSVESVRKWIRDGLLGADSVGDGSAAFEYRIPETELLNFAAKYRLNG